MPKSPLEKLKLERRQVRRAFTKTFNDGAPFLDKSAPSEEDLSTLKSIMSALTTEFNDCQELDKELRSIVLEEIDDETEQDAFFDEVNEVTSVNRGKIAKLEFLLSKFEKKCSASPTPVASKLPDLQLPFFDGKIRVVWFLGEISVSGWQFTRPTQYGQIYVFNRPVKGRGIENS